MKKLFIFVFFMLGIIFSACNNGSVNEVESVSTDTIGVVSNYSDSIHSMQIVEKDSMVQCKGITKNGIQCVRMVKYPDTLCFQHKKTK